MAADRAGGSAAPGEPDGAIRDEARRLLDEARAEVKATLKERLLEAALRELDDAPADIPVEPPRRRAGGRREIDETVRAIGSLADHDPQDPDSEPSATGLYAYGVCSSRVSTPASTGIDGEPVGLVDVGDHRVLVTPVPLGEFEGEALERRLTDPAWLGEHATAHERVLASAMREGSVLPLRFGTIFADDEQLRRALAPHAALFGEALARAEHREEWDVKVVCETVALRGWIEATSPRISELLAEANGEDGSAYLRRKRLDRALAEEAERATDELGRVVSEALAVCAEATAPVAATDDPDAAPRAVIRADAYLVHRDRAEAFRRAADETETLLADRGVEVLITGPLPPYHFVSLDLREAADA